MTAEGTGGAVELQERRPQPVVSIRAIVKIADLGPAMDDRIPALWDYIQRSGAAAAGAPYVRYHTFGEGETDLETGIPVAAPVAGEGRITGGELPGGPAIITWHYGSHETFGEAYARLAEWQREHGRQSAGAAWEVYYWLDPGQYRGAEGLPDSATWRTELIQPLQ